MNQSKAHLCWIFDVLGLFTQILIFFITAVTSYQKFDGLQKYLFIICLFPWVRSLSTRWLRFSAYGHEVKVKVLIGLGCCLGGSLLLGLFKLLVEFCVVPGCWPGDTLSSWNKQPSADGHGLSLCLSAFAFSSASFSDLFFPPLLLFRLFHSLPGYSRIISSDWHILGVRTWAYLQDPFPAYHKSNAYTFVCELL